MSPTIFSESSFLMRYKKKSKNLTLLSVLMLGCLFSNYSVSSTSTQNERLIKTEKEKLKLSHIEALLDYENKYDLNSLAQKKYFLNKMENIKEIIKDNKEDRLTRKQHLIAQHISSKYAKLDLKTAKIIVKEAYIKADKYNIDPEILLAIAGVESNYDHRVVNRIGASGLTQVMKKYHGDKIRKINAKGGNILNIDDNLDLGAEIYSSLYKKYNGNQTLALQAYNGSIKDKKRGYSKKVMRELNEIKLAMNKKI